MSQKEDIKALLDKHGLTVESVFVPWSKSRNSGEKNPSLNWKVTLKHGGRAVLTTDYMAGCGHAPSYQQRKTYDSKKNVGMECETGFRCRELYTMGAIVPVKNSPILPDSVDVVYSLLIDSEVLDAGGFEEWAREFGYEEDSREAEKTYNARLKIALQFRKIGESVISELREAYQDY